MDLRIFTLPFDPILETFPDDVVTAFCLNKKVYKLESQFFQQDGRAYWSVAVHYEVVTKAEVEKVRDLDEGQQLLYDRLREWRKETGQFINQRANGLSFLGTRIFPSLVRLHPENARRAARKLILKRRALAGELLDEASYFQSLNSYCSYFSVYGTYVLRKKLLLKE